jgi:hypothetical protein
LEACLGSVSHIICITLSYLTQRRRLWPVASGHLFLSAASEGKKQPPPRYFYQPTHHHHHQPVFHIHSTTQSLESTTNDPTKPRNSARRKSRLTGTVIHLHGPSAGSFKHCIASFPYRVLHPLRRRTAFDCVPLSFAHQSTSWHSFLQSSGPPCRDRCCEVRGSAVVYKALRHASDSADAP